MTKKNQLYNTNLKSNETAHYLIKTKLLVSLLTVSEFFFNDTETLDQYFPNSFTKSPPFQKFEKKSPPPHNSIQ